MYIYSFNCLISIWIITFFYVRMKLNNIIWPECGKDLDRGSLAVHCQTQHGVAKVVTWQEGEGEGGNNGPRTYRVTFTTKAGSSHCPVEGFSGQAETQTAMRVKFWHRNVWDTVVILGEGNLSHLRCPLCDMMVLWRYFNESHKRTSQWKKGADRKRRILAAEEARAVTSR